jgi:hypothetical protein
MYIYNYCPGNCHGSRERVKGWIDKGGLKGKKDTIDEIPGFEGTMEDINNLSIR